ncbi:hypothetical protein SEA_GILGAMESH_30 [Streptomyces phage Gilgamesh]|uniref:Uncharacterized protein n=1 Tax=Streptomyces phage Gilgamesh TaxID=2599890 RepID=A0A5J6TXK2_9CAUD|nr:hypothetical protein QEH35_gp030 [Streptomyces phage Gilgamesh]QFG13222.1 hypothetical protein SEA_GILGAMESH_30 [Streptomyces phage Gilgamesh]
MTDTAMPARPLNPLYTEETARAWYDFIADRLADALGAAYPTTNSGPAVGDYREKLRVAQAKHQRFVDAWHGGDPERIENGWWGLKNIADEWRTHADFPEPISDGTLPCPIPAPETGHPCVKPIHPGWTPSEGHGGGHCWQSPKFTALQEAGAHIDNRALLAGQPATYHLPKDCTPDCWQWRDR